MDSGEKDQAIAESSGSDVTPSLDGHDGLLTKPISPPVVETARSKNHEMTVSSMVRLMGLSTSQDASVLEAKIDAMMSRMTALSSKVDRLSAQMKDLKNERQLDHIVVQLSDLRGLIKKLFSGESSISELSEVNPEVTEEERPARRALKLTSSPVDASSDLPEQA